MIQESNEDMCGMGISKQSESAKKNDRYVSAGAKPEKNAWKAEAQCMEEKNDDKKEAHTTFHFSYDICELHTFGMFLGGRRGGKGGVKLDEAKTCSRDTFLITYRFNIT